MNIDGLIGHAALVLLSVGIAAALAAISTSTSLQRRADAHRQSLDHTLRFLQSRLTGAQVLRVQLLVVLALLVLAAVLGQIWIVGLAIPVFVGPGTLLQRAHAARVTNLEEQLDAWLLLLSNALRASPSLGKAIAASARLIPSPMSEELTLALKEYELGTPLDRALEAMAQRIGSRTVTSALLMLRIARNTGGNLNETLESGAAALREMARLEGVVRAKTAEGKAQAFVISAIPFPLVGAMQWLSPGFLQPLFNKPMGHLVLLGAAGLWVCALIMAQRIVAVDV